MVELLESAAATMLVVGVVLTIGGGVFAAWVAPEALDEASRRLLVLGAVLGALAIVGASLGDAALALARVARQPLDAALLWTYLTDTQHGGAALARSLLAVPLAVSAAMLASASPARLAGSLGARPAGHAGAVRPAGALGGRRGRATLVVGFLLAALATLLSISLVSHSGALGTLGALADLLHLIGTAAWVGAVLYLAWLPVWREPRALLAAVRRVGMLGVISVAVLAATGIGMATLHLYGLAALSATDYGLTLVVKSTLVVLVLGIAATNRFVLVPLLEQRAIAWPLARAVRLESLVLLGVLLASGVLTTREPAHAPAPAPTRPAGEATDPHAHDAHGHAPASPATANHETGANRFATDVGTVVIEGGALGELRFALEPPLAARLDLEAIAPDGSFHVLGEEVALEPGGAATVALPQGADGIWTLLLTLDAADRSALRELAITRHQAVTASGVEVVLVLVPTPTVGGGGLTEAFVAPHLAGRSMHAPVEIEVVMPGMVHDTDGVPVPLAMDHERADAAHRGRLAFPMAGVWQLVARVGLGEAAWEIVVLDE